MIVTQKQIKTTTMKEEKLIEKIKQQTEELWQTIQEAKKSNLKIQVGFSDYRNRPEIEITKTVFSQGVQQLLERLTPSS